MTNIDANIRVRGRRSWRRRAVSVVAIIGLLFGGLMPLAQAATPSGAGTLLAAICSPNGVRYIEIDLGEPGQDAPQTPLAGGLEHCPGCLGSGGSALLPVAVAVASPPVADRIAPSSCHQLFATRTETSFRPRAPPSAS